MVLTRSVAVNATQGLYCLTGKQINTLTWHKVLTNGLVKPSTRLFGTILQPEKLHVIVAITYECMNDVHRQLRI